MKNMPCFKVILLFACVYTYSHKTSLLVSMCKHGKQEHNITQWIESYHFMQNNGNWCSDLKEILRTLNKEHTLVNHETINLSYASEIFFEKMNEHFQNEIQNKPKLRSFKLYKSNVKTEKYVTANLSRTQRSLMAKIRSGTLCLAVETGRFRSIPLENRLCELCNSSVEDEKHFICQCPFFSTLRSKLLSDLALLSTSLSIEDLFIKIMSTEKIYSLANYVEKAWHLRKCYLFNL